MIPGAAATTERVENRIGGGRWESLWRGRRLAIMGLLFAASLINYIDRVSMSVAAPAVAKEFRWDPGTMGIILSSFLWTYALFLVPMGWLTDKIGPRKLNAVAISLWSLAAMVTGMATNFVTMLMARLALGAGESSTMPSGSAVVRRWFTIQERGLATALARSGADAGPAIGMPIVAWLVVAYGWRVSFVATGALGFVWLFFWLKFFRNSPRECSWLSAEEREHIENNTDGDKHSAEKPRTGLVWRLLRQKTMWGLALSQGCIMYTQYMILTWLPSYLVQTKNMQLMRASIVSSCAFAAAWLFGIGVCKISDLLLTPERVRLGHRRLMVVIFMTLSCIFLYTIKAEGPWMIFIIITLSKAFLTSSIGLNMSLTNDLVANPAVAGTVFGLLLLGGNIFGSMAPIVTGYLIGATGNYDSAFLVAGGLIVCGALIVLLMVREPIDVA